jgi:hypothetical protein
MSARAIRITVVVVALSLCLSGCGSGTLTAGELRTKATVVCRTAVRHSDRIALPSSNTAGSTFLAEGIAVFRPELVALRKLAPPHRLAEAYRAALADANQQLDALIATDHNLQSGGDPVVAIKQLDIELAAINLRDHAAWTTVGVPACANLTPGQPG